VAKKRGESLFLSRWRIISGPTPKGRRATVPPRLTIIRIAGFPADGQPAGIWVGQTFDLVKDRVVFGRARENDIPLFAFCKARHHGQLLRAGDDYYVEGFPGTPYPTLVNGAPVAGRTLLREGDVLSVYRVSLVYRRGSEADAHPGSP
jgi:pSer/pThr/pTyr-binding forkhead associated (FHA) protein